MGPQHSKSSKRKLKHDRKVRPTILIEKNNHCIINVEAL